MDSAELIRLALETRDLLQAQQVALLLAERRIDWRGWLRDRPPAPASRGLLQDAREDLEFVHWTLERLLRYGRVSSNGAHLVRMRAHDLEEALATGRPERVLVELIRLWQTLVARSRGDGPDAAEAPVPLEPIIPVRSFGRTSTG